MTKILRNILVRLVPLGPLCNVSKCNIGEETTIVHNLNYTANALYSGVRPKPGFGIGNQNQGPISVLVSKTHVFFSETETYFFKFFQIFSCFSASLGEYEFSKSLKLNTDLQK